MIREAGEPPELLPAAEDRVPYVERPANEQLYQALVSGRWAFVAGLPQSGKTSLALHTARRLNEAGVWTLRLDLSERSDQESDRWYAAQAVQIGKALGNEAAAAAYVWDNQESPPSEWLFGMIRALPASCEGPIVLFFDGIDEAPVTGELYAGLARLAEEPGLDRVAICVLDSSLLGGTAECLPLPSAVPIRLPDLTLDELRELAAQAGAPPNAAQAVYRWTEGHPYLSRLLLSDSSSDADSLVRRMLAKPGGDAHLSATLEKIAEKLLGATTGSDRLAVLNLYRRLLAGPMADDGEPSLQRIKESGLCRAEGGKLAIRNQLFAKAFDAAWVRKQMVRPSAPPDRRKLKNAGRWAVAAVLGTAVLAVAALGMRQVVLTLLARHSRPPELTMAGYLDGLKRVALSLETGQYSDAKDILRDYSDFDGRTTAFDYLETIAEGGERIFLGHTNRATGVRFLAGGTQVATGSFDGTITIFNIQSGRLVAMLKIGEPLQCLAVSADGKLMAAGSANGSIVVFDVPTRKRLWTGKLVSAVNWVSFSHDGKLLGVSGRQPDTGGGKPGNFIMKVGLWRVSDGRKLSEIEDQGGQGTSLSFSRDDKSIAVGGASGYVYLYSVPGLKRTNMLMREGGRVVQSVWYSADGHTIGQTDGDGSMAVYDASGEFLWDTVGKGPSANAVVGTKDGKLWITCGDDSHVRIWDATAGRQVGDDNLGIGLQDEWLSPDESMIALASTDGATHVLPLRALEMPREAALGPHVACLDVSEKGHVVASADPAGAISVLDSSRSPDPIELHLRPGEKVDSVSLSPKGRYLAAAYHSGTMEVVDLIDRKTVLRVEGCAEPRFAPDGSKLVVDRKVGGAGAVVEYSIAGWRRKLSYEASKAADYRFVFSPDGSRLIGVGRDGGNQIWDAATGKSLYAGRQPGRGDRPVAWSPDGKTVAQYQRPPGQAIGLYDRTGKWIMSVDGADPYYRNGKWLPSIDRAPDRMEGLAFTPDSKLLVGVGRTTQLCIWDLVTGQMLIDIQGSAQSDRRVEFDAAGRLWLTGGNGPAYVVAPFTKQQYQQLGEQGRQRAMLVNRSRLASRFIGGRSVEKREESGAVPRERLLAGHDLQTALNVISIARHEGVDGPGLLGDKARYELLLGRLGPAIRDSQLLIGQDDDGAKARGYETLALAYCEKGDIADCRKALFQLCDQSDPSEVPGPVVIACSLCQPDALLGKLLSEQLTVLGQMNPNSASVALAKGLIAVHAGQVKVSMNQLGPLAGDHGQAYRLVRLFALYGEVLCHRKMGMTQDATAALVRAESVYGALKGAKKSLDDQESFIALTALRRQALAAR